MKRVVVTGLGIVSPLGSTIQEFWANIQNGRCGIAPITRFDTTDYKVKLAAEVQGFDPLDYMKPLEANRNDPYIQYALAASQQAVDDSGILGQIDSERFGVLFGSAVGGVTTCFREHEKLLASGPRRVSPFLIPVFIVNMASGMIAIRFDCRGPVMPMATACATGSSAIGEAYEKILAGAVDAVIAGGSEAAITECLLAGFTNMKALSLSEDPLAASLPFDQRRAGFVVGEGAGALILEDYDHAIRRGAPIYGEVCGYGSTCDAYHLATPRPDAEQGARSMLMALKQADWEPGESVYVNAHGTATKLGDVAETLAIHHVFDPSGALPLVSSTKSMTGHMIGAAGAAEAIVSLLALRDGVVPPTIGLTQPDPECDLDYIPLQSRQAPISLAISNSFGFGGHNATVAFRRG